ncbi:hypothetical protein OKW96_20865 [Sphingobacterium sp. KU25419]|nr:hypothetical protein OKW96_20865 [Sphingobacterium sp. KU25419]
MSIDKDMRMGYDLKMFESVEAMQDGNFKRMTPQQQEKYINYYRPIYEELKQSKLTGKALAEWKFKRYMTDYLNTAQSMDRNIGKVLDYIESNSLRKIPSLSICRIKVFIWANMVGLINVGCMKNPSAHRWSCVIQH